MEIVSCLKFIVELKTGWKINLQPSKWR